jgi:hypothetical protein
MEKCWRIGNSCWVRCYLLFRFKVYSSIPILNFINQNFIVKQYFLSRRKLIPSYSNFLLFAFAQYSHTFNKEQCLKTTEVTDISVYTRSSDSSLFLWFLIELLKVCLHTSCRAIFGPCEFPWLYHCFLHEL